MSLKNNLLFFKNKIIFLILKILFALLYINLLISFLFKITMKKMKKIFFKYELFLNKKIISITCESFKT